MQTEGGPADAEHIAVGGDIEADSEEHEAILALYSHLHPATAEYLPLFEWEHLPPRLQGVSQQFWALAHQLVTDSELTGPQLAHSLRYLLMAKDCAVRAGLPTDGPITVPENLRLRAIAAANDARRVQPGGSTAEDAVREEG